MKKPENVYDLLIDQLEALKASEESLLIEYPFMASKVSPGDLRNLIAEHINRTRSRIERIEQIFELLSIKPSFQVCEKTSKLIKDARIIINNSTQQPVKDMEIASLLLSHFKMKSTFYDFILLCGNVLGIGQVSKALQQTMAEEEEIFSELTRLRSGTLMRKD